MVAKNGSSADIFEVVQKQGPEAIKQLRKMEYDLAAAKAKYVLEVKKRRQAEGELADARKREDLFLGIKASLAEPIIRAVKRSKKLPTATPVVCCTDWHAEACVDKEVVSGLNEFNLQVCESRIQRTWIKVGFLIDLWRSVSTIEDAVLWLGGDLISGSIHEELEESNLLGPSEAILFVQTQIMGGIKYLLDEVGIKKLTVVCNHGNHSRTTRKLRPATAYRHSWEWLAYQHLSTYYRKDPRVTFYVSKGIHSYVTIQGWTVRFHHGDRMKYGGGVGGITVPVNKAISAWNMGRRADYDVFGHFHQFIEHKNWVCCNTLMGLDAFALDIKAAYQLPTQTLIFFDREHGKLASLEVFV